LEPTDEVAAQSRRSPASWSNGTSHPYKITVVAAADLRRDRRLAESPFAAKGDGGGNI